VKLRLEAKLLGALLFSCASGAIAAGEERTERCGTPPKLVVADSKSEYSPPSTAMPPVGTVVLEVTVTADGTIRDVLVVEPVDSRLQRWAIEESKNLRFAPVGKACRTRLTLESRITEGQMTHNKRIESARIAHPTRKRVAPLLAAHAGRWASKA
jgi:TonB family protein